MKILFIHPDYPAFMEWLYARQPGLADASYGEQIAARNASLFAVADFWARNLELLGHEGIDIYANNRIMQLAWAREHGVAARTARTGATALAAASRSARSLARAATLPALREWLRERLRVQPTRDPVLEAILVEQVRHYQPDVIVNTALDSTHPAALARLKPLTGLLVGQVASPFSSNLDVSAYDLVVTSMPHLRDRFIERGIPSHLLRLGFDAGVLQAVPVRERDIAVSFVGAVTPAHGGRLEWLERVCASVDVAVWGSGAGQLPPDSPIRRYYRGEAWGIEMFEILGRSRITLNHHIDMAGRNANNMRLYEATGMGALLVTDHKDNLSDMFEPGREVVTYTSAADCIEQVTYYNGHAEERQRIAALGQNRTLTEHTYNRRMSELVDILARYI